MKCVITIILVENFFENYFENLSTSPYCLRDCNQGNIITVRTQYAGTHFFAGTLFCNLYPEMYPKLGRVL